jgi:tetratricopeptide (TPR) repeat protein
MARKKRKIHLPEPPPTDDKKPKTQFRDSFQKDFGKKVEGFVGKLEGSGRTILYAAGAAVILGIIVLLIYRWNQSSTQAAQAALGHAIDISQSRVTDVPVPAGSTETVFKTEKERAEAAIAAFTDVVNKYGGNVGEKASYLAAVNKIAIDREAAAGELQTLSQKNDAVGKLAKFALAQVREGDGKYDEAVALYTELAGMDDPVVAKDTLNSYIAAIYEKQGKTKEAADVYYKIAKDASEAKDASGKSIPMSLTATDAKAKLEKLDPERAKEIQEPLPELPAGL